MFIVYTYHITGALKIKEHLADEHAPTLLRVAVFHFCQPALYRWFIIFPAEQELRCVSPLHVLQHSYPVFHRGDAVRSQVISLFTSGYFESGSSFSSIDPERNAKIYETADFSKETKIICIQIQYNAFLRY